MPSDSRLLYERFAPTVHRRAVALLGKDAEAWEIVHEVCERLANAVSADRPMARVYHVSTAACLKRLRDRPPPLVPTIAAAQEARELEADTLRRLDRLDEDEIGDVLGRLPRIGMVLERSANAREHLSDLALDELAAGIRFELRRWTHAALCRRCRGRLARIELLRDFLAGTRAYAVASGRYSNGAPISPLRRALARMGAMLGS